MPATPNGHAWAGAPRRLVVVPETKTYLIERPNPFAPPLAERKRADEIIAAIGQQTADLLAQARDGKLSATDLKFGLVELVSQLEPDTAIVPVTGYVNGPRCPTVVDIEVQAVREEYSERAYIGVEVTDEETGNVRTTRQYRFNAEVEATWVRRMLKAVIPSLTDEDVQVLANERGPWREILGELGWYSVPATATAGAESTEGDADPEVTGEEAAASTGTASSPNSDASTQAPTS